MARRWCSAEVDSHPPIFTSETSNIIPGELLVQFHEDLAAQISASIARGRRIATTRRFGLPLAEFTMYYRRRYARKFIFALQLRKLG